MSIGMLAQLMAREHSPRFHGNGFAQLYLSKNTRLHVWDQSLSRIPGHNAAVHDHVYNMQSRVLLGTLIQVTYELPARGYRPQEDEVVDIFRLNPASPDPRGMPDFEHISRGYIRETGRLQITEGRLYWQARDVLHDSEPGLGGPVATLFQRLSQPDDEQNPRVICPAGERPSNAFAPEHQPSQTALWSAIASALDAMPAESRLLLEEIVS